MIDYESYKKIQEWYELGLSIRKIAQKLNLANATVKRYTTIPEAEYFELQKNSGTLSGQLQGILFRAASNMPANQNNKLVLQNKREFQRL